VTLAELHDPVQEVTADLAGRGGHSCVEAKITELTSDPEQRKQTRSTAKIVVRATSGSGRARPAHLCQSRPARGEASAQQDCEDGEA